MSGVRVNLGRMTKNPETSRLAAHKLLDLASAFDNETGTLPEGAYERIVTEIYEIGAISIQFPDTSPDEGSALQITVNVNELFGAIGFLLGLFVNYAADKSGGDRLAVINILRGLVDSSYAD